MLSFGAISELPISTLPGASDPNAFTASGSIVLSGAAGLTGIGTVEAAGSIVLSGAADLTGIGTVAAAGSVVLSGAADVVGIGSVDAAGSIVLSGAAALTADDITASGSLVLSGAADLTGIGTIEAAGSIVFSGAAALTDTGEPVTIGGSWLSPAQIRRLRRRIHKLDRTEPDRRRAEEARIRDTLERAFDGRPLVDIPEAVSPYVSREIGDSTLPVIVLDWSALVVDLDAVRALLAVIEAERDEEDAIEALLLAA